MCDEGTGHETDLAAALAKVAELRRSLVMDPIRAVDLKGDDEKRDRDVQASAAEMKKLRTTIAKLTTLCAKYRLHKEQYEKCREEVEKLEARLLPGECLLFRDFVAQYTANGSKMSNLQLVCLYRNVKDGPLFQFQVSNFSLTQSQDKYYVADVMDFHMKAKEDGGSGLLSKFTTVYVSGDHGTHFSDIYTIYNESRMFEKYGKVVHIVSLCSYHCYNRCDAAGVHSKKLGLQAAKEREPLELGEHYTDAVNDDGTSYTLAWNWVVINRSVDVFGVGVVLTRPLNLGVRLLREICEFSFGFEDEHGKVCHIPGIVKCREVPFSGKFIIIDLVTDRQNSWCDRCTQFYQRPVKHTEDLEKVGIMTQLWH